MPFYEYFREAIRNTATPLFNCHSFAFRGWMGNPSDPRNEYPISQGATRWHNNPDKDLENYIALDPDADSLVGDRVTYFVDLNEDGQWSEGEEILHSAIVNKVDDSGNILTIIQKDGPNAIVVSSPIHSNYEKPPDLMGNYVITTRAYFRKVETEEPSDVE